jgi:beta-galactosidase
MKKNLFFLLLASLLAFASCGPKSDIWTDRAVPGKPLVQWSFSKDGESWETVSIPHSYNAQDGHSPAYYRGTAHYKTTLPKAKEPRYLLFEGAAQAAKVYLNGELVAEHSGGYTPFWVNLTGKLTAGKNELEVVCDNAEALDRIPLTSDFNKNGGLHNPVWLLECPPVHFSPDAFGLYRMHVSQLEVSDDKAVGRAETRICNASGADAPVNVSWTLLDQEGKEVLTHSETVSVAAGASADASWDFTLEQPHLWNGIPDPYLYTVSVKAGKDQAQTEVGFRYVQLDRVKGFQLNGKSYPLRGVSMHQDRAGKASALWREDFDADYEIVKEVGANFLRLAHYPHNDYAFRLCDRMGIIVQTEIPWVNNCGVNAPQAYFDNIYQQMEEMVTSLYNHPSICFWGMWNELDSWGNQPGVLQGELDARRVVDETARLYDFTKKLDPSRFVGLTDDSMFQRDFYTELKADYYSENRYHGWYYNYGKFWGLADDMEWIQQNMGITNLSEYGVGINPGCHNWDVSMIVRDPTDTLHLEEYGNLAHEAFAQQIAQAPYLNFTSLWVMFDFAVASREEGFMDSDNGLTFIYNDNRKFTNDKGIVTRDRKVKKDVFYLYKSWWNKEEETVHIANKRLKYCPPTLDYTLTVYSNAPSLKVISNGQVIRGAATTGEPTGVIFKFRVRMGEKPTTYRVESPSGTYDEITLEPLTNFTIPSF